MFCSRKCSNRYNNQEKIVYKICQNPECGKTFKKGKNRLGKFCSRACMGTFVHLQTISKFEKGLLTDGKVRTPSIRKHLLEKQNNKCAECGMFNIWNGKDIVFIIDHIDGNYKNNKPENIRAICPNCSSQTENFAGRNKGFSGRKLYKRKRHNKQE